MPDISVWRTGSIVMFQPNTDAAQGWVAENVNLESWQWLGRAFGVEFRFAPDLGSAMMADGLSVADL